MSFYLIMTFCEGYKWKDFVLFWCYKSFSLTGGIEIL